MIDASILAAIEARLCQAMGPPPKEFRRFEVEGIALGFIDDDRATRLASFDCLRVSADAVTLDARLASAQARSAAIAEVTHALRIEGALAAWRDELYAVAAAFGDPPLLLIERGAARYFGVRTYAAHVNGIVSDNGETRMWLARRSDRKAVDPGLLDNLVGGGISAGFRVDDTVVKEAWEEAGIAPSLARGARPAGIVEARKRVFDGLQRETLFVHDLVLPMDFVPSNQDGEAVEHRLVSLGDAARAISASSGPEEVTHDASLVMLDFLIRQGAIRPDQPHYAALAGLRHARP
jgi:8-oxo-dGTP pyrophosphatase MutT (NUDIX family)